MNKLLPFFSVLCLAASTLVFASGCASTPTRASTGEFIDDSVITTKVKSELVRNDATPGGAIKVETFKGVVQLSGFVDTEVQKTEAGTVASKVDGVKQVTNNIIVSSVPTKTSAGEFIDDSVITTKVKTALVRDDFTPGGAIKVDTSKGIVQLSGFVDTPAQKVQAGLVAGAVAGIKGVVNNIVVK
jgi:hyperosmotically inducible periplasmic protein